MTLFKNRFRVESARLQGYDYASPGWYYVTINTKNRICWFGDVGGSKMIRNKWGVIARQCWISIPEHFPNVSLDEFIVIPNHLHGIVVIETTAHKQHPIIKTGIVGNNHTIIQIRGYKSNSCRRGITIRMATTVS